MKFIMSTKLFPMLNRITLVLALITCLVWNVQAQDDTWSKPNVTDNMTKSADQNKKWRMGQYNYSAKPKNAIELGIHGGHFHINGDVPSQLPSGFGVGLHIRKAFNYVFSWRLGAQYSQSSGLDGRPSIVQVLKLDNSNLTFPGYDNNDILYRNFKAVNYQGSFEVITNIGNLLFHKPRNKWNFYAGIGLGITAANVTMDYYNGTNPYNFSSISGENTRAKRDAIKAILDGSKESEFENDRDVESLLFDNGKIFPSFVASVGISRKINKRVNVTLEHQVWAQDYDKWDGHEYRSIFDQTNDSDIAHYTNVRIGINLGNFDKVTEPLYWLNPIDASFNDIAELKQRPVLDLTDADADGVVDMLDQELGSTAGCPVDTRGVTLDSDGDRIPDCKDKEPFSPPGYDVDEKGVAQVPVQVILTEQDVNTIVDSKVGALQSTLVKSGCGEWFLPMIHFDLNKYYIKPEYYGQLHHVAEVLAKCPDLCVTVEGHTDSRNSNDYNKVLSYNRSKAAIDYLVMNYGISRDRLKLMYGGEENPLIKNVPNSGGGEVSSQQLMNRRVEFRVCNATDFDMNRPEGPEAGSGYGKSGGAKGSTYSGNKNSGY